MEPPDEWHGFYESEPDSDMNDHYSKEDAYERMLRETKSAVKRARTFKSNVDMATDQYGCNQTVSKKLLQIAAESNYEAMWPVVHAICESLQFETHKWEFGSNRFKHLENGCDFWCHGMISPVTETFMMGEKASEQVFNQAQGEAILEALKIARVVNPTNLQKTLLDRFGIAKHKIVDERYSIHVPDMNFWQRLWFLVTARCKIK